MADLIVVLDGGCVREVGSHEELLAADRAAAQSAVDQARASLAKLTNGATPATLDLNQARIHQADVQVSEAEQALKDAELIAPADGVVTDLNITLGEPSTTGTTSSSGTPASAITVADLSSLHFETSDLDEVGAAKVYLGEPVKVYLGEPVKVTVAVLNKQTFDGTVTDVALQPTITSSGDVNYTAEISLKDLPPGLRWGRTAQVEFLPTK